MVFITPFIGAAALLSGAVSALPRPQEDSASGPEVAVSAPNGTPISDTAALAAQTGSSEGSAYAPPPSGGEYAPEPWVESSAEAWPAYGASEAWPAEPSSEAWPVYETTAAWVETSAAWVESQAWTSTAAAVESWPTYGSGSTGASGYDDCVQQCIASYGAPPVAYTPPTPTGGEEPAGNGATHTVIVAPTQGVLRYIPFALNASVGDTVKFMWGANNHTVTKGSALTPCNRSADALFASGAQNKDFVFTQVVNSTEPTFYYCATPTHCQKGMFGIINPPNAAGAPSSVGSMMQQVAANNSDISAYASYVDTQTQGTKAATWGTNLDMGALPEWAQPFMAENVLYTRSVLAANPDIQQEDGSIDLSNMGSTPMMIPEDISVALNSAATPSSADSSAGSSDAASATSDSSAESTSAAATEPGNGAGALASPKALVAFMAILATLFAL